MVSAISPSQYDDQVSTLERPVPLGPPGTDPNSAPVALQDWPGACGAGNDLVMPFQALSTFGVLSIGPPGLNRVMQ
ncbi:hypothetical protein M878_44375 [Streptomyces roseochromogenus subsp. oscitans DS 12.976]|uniref:Uncharacterized protein n=1 Tax=Streptomyces roseochromogenus subsp. oscitans DS 12.976 TaxID=1352936 RepID=V6JIH2_STRRC|nr:hypothetical protein M878_44375 [Streptomyces roseochromogenus subsp. oscitans DS 12.976]